MAPNHETALRVDLSLDNNAFADKYGRRKKMAAVTLGCKSNQYDTGVIIDSFIKDGYEIVDFNSGSADVCVVNTCSVTGLSDRKSRQMIRRARARNPNTFVVAAGCYPQSSYDEACRILESGDADLVVGTADRLSIPRHIRREGLNAGTGIIIPDIWQIDGFGTPVTDPCTEHSRAYIKIQDGCDNFCSYCIIPHIRGKKRSKPPEEAVEEAERAAAAGFAEIVLTGICLSDYGEDLGNTDLAEVARLIGEIPGIKRIRFGSLEPAAVNAGFIESVAGNSKVCRHFHISLQSGSNTVLERMNRHYGAADYRNSVTLLLERLPDAAVTTDVIVGFPGETDDEFLQTVEFLRGMPFSRMHIFKYSRRKGTPADKYGGQVPAEVKEERSKVLLELSDAKSLEFNRKAVCRTVQVLAEKMADDRQTLWEGLTGNYIRVIFRQEGAPVDKTAASTAAAASKKAMSDKMKANRILAGAADLKGKLVSVFIEKAFADHAEGRMVGK